LHLRRGHATTAAVAGAAGQTGDGAADALKAWRQVRDAGDIQFAPLPPEQPVEPSPWLQALARLLRAIFEPLGRAIGLSWPILEKLLIAAAAALVLLVLWRLIAPWIVARRARPATAADTWAPDRAEAAALLADADRLAGEGRFGEAVHLLLRRSVEQIGTARPGSLRPASTAREIAALAFLPARARAAFAVIAARVERSLFALRTLDRTDWDAARAAYADFALSDLATDLAR
jgi:hypothetical protein